MRLEHTVFTMVFLWTTTGADRTAGVYFMLLFLYKTEQSERQVSESNETLLTFLL